MLEVCFCVYKRASRIPELMKQFKEQTHQDFRVNIWNNSRNEIDCRNFSNKRVRIFGGKGNIGSQARFRLVPETSGNPIIFIDDDLSIEKDFIEYYYKKYLEYGQRAILGWFSKTWNKDEYHNPKGFLLPEDSEVDYLGTGGMILNRLIIEGEKSLQNIPEQYAKVEDLYLSAMARKNGIELYSIKPKCKIICDGLDQHKGLKDYKQEAFFSLRKEGWKLLYENIDSGTSK